MKVLSKQFVLLTLLGLTVAPQVGAYKCQCEWLKNGGCSKLYGVFGEFFDELTQNIKSLNELNRNNPTNDFINLAADINDKVCTISIFTQNSSCPKNCPIHGKILQTTTIISHAAAMLTKKILAKDYPELKSTRVWLNSCFEILQKTIITPTKQ